MIDSTGWKQELFNYMAQEYKISLLDSELEDIHRITHCSELPPDSSPIVLGWDPTADYIREKQAEAIVEAVHECGIREQEDENRFLDYAKRLREGAL